MTCTEHAGECPALDGEPRKTVEAEKKAKETGSGLGEKATSAKAVSTPQGAAKKSARKEIQKAKPIPRKFAVPPQPLADYVEVYSDPIDGTITAYMIRRHSELAVRWWAMTEEGIFVNCECEKMWNCRERGLVYYPWDDLGAQMNDLLTRFREEYHLPDKKDGLFSHPPGKALRGKEVENPFELAG